MDFRDSNQVGSEEKYISKKVMINGQFVTLYSSNGQTWVSSPEEIPALMERLDTARITITTGGKLPEGEAAKVVKPEAKEEDRSVPQKVMQTKYRLKGPKPRPILKQDGLVIEGTPIEPISASNTTLSFSSDGEVPLQRDAIPAKPKKVAKQKGSVHKAPIFQKKVAPVVAAKVAKPAVEAKKLDSVTRALKNSVAKAAGKAAPAKNTKASASKPVAAKAKTLKSTKKATPVSTSKPAKKPAPKAAAKKPVAKKTSKKSKTGKR